jgi:hypothetical protein
MSSPSRSSGLLAPRSSGGHPPSATSARCVTPTVGRSSTAPRCSASPARRGWSRPVASTRSASGGCASARGGLEQGSLAESEQARLVGSGGAAGHGDGLAARARSCPRPVSGAAGPAAAAGEADEDRAEPRAGLEPPQQGVERGQPQLLLDELLARARPLAHALILAAALPCRCPRERRVSMCWSKHEREQWERELDSFPRSTSVGRTSTPRSPSSTARSRLSPRSSPG